MISHGISQSVWQIDDAVRLNKCVIIMLLFHSYCNRCGVIDQILFQLSLLLLIEDLLFVSIQ